MRKPPLGKMDIVKLLRRKYALGEVLEISTPTTGLTFAELRDDVPDAHRLVYKFPADVDDGQTYTYRTNARISGIVTNAILAANHNAPCYDLVFVDPFHTYDCSATDLSGAFALLRAGGIMVVHDCNPECASLTAPEFLPGDWLGVTYMAFIDFVLSRGELGFYTIDTDYGCAVVYKDRKLPRGSSPISNGARERLTRAWNATRHDDAARFEFFAQHRRDLLNLKSIEEFAALEGFALAPALVEEAVWS
jgi:hypothetical protein